MIRIECESEGRVRVIGSLDRHTVPVLFDAISDGAVALDLSEVLTADEEAVTFLACLDPERCAIVSPPSWLAIWIERLRGAGDA